MVRVILGLITIFLLTAPLHASEIEELKKEVVVLQVQIKLEQARFEEAKAKMERSQVVWKFLIPQLRAKVEALEKKIQEAGKEKESEDSE